MSLLLAKEANRLQKQKERKEQDRRERELHELWVTYRNKEEAKVLEAGIRVPDADGEDVSILRYEDRQEPVGNVDWTVPPKRPFASVYPSTFVGAHIYPGDMCFVMDEFTFQELRAVAAAAPDFKEETFRPALYKATLINLSIINNEYGLKVQWQFLKTESPTTIILPPDDRQDVSHFLARVNTRYPERRVSLAFFYNREGSRWVDKYGVNQKPFCKCVVDNVTHALDLLSFRLRFEYFIQHTVHRSIPAGCAKGDGGASSDGRGEGRRRKHQLDEPTTAAPAARTEPVYESRKRKATGGGAGAYSSSSEDFDNTPAAKECVTKKGGPAAGGGGSGGGSAGGRRDVARGRPSPGGGNRERVAASRRHLGASESSEHRVDIVGKKPASKKPAPKKPCPRGDTGGGGGGGGDATLTQLFALNRMLSDGRLTESQFQVFLDTLLRHG